MRVALWKQYYTDSKSFHFMKHKAVTYKNLNQRDSMYLQDFCSLNVIY